MEGSKLLRALYDAYCLAQEYLSTYRALRDTFKNTPGLTEVFGESLLQDCYRKWSEQSAHYEWLASRVAFLHPN